MLIGDSGQHDAAIYREVVRRHPGRVLAVYIREVASSAARHQNTRALLDEVGRAGAQAAFGPDLIEAAENAAAQGWIDPKAASRISEEVNSAAEGA